MKRPWSPIESTIEIAAPPQRVWRILCDFKSYPRWNPYRTIQGEAVLGGKIVLAIGPNPERRRHLKATIHDLRPGETLALRNGTRPLLDAVESFHLERTARGTLLRHRTEMSGLLVGLFDNDRFRANLLTVYAVVDKALRDYALGLGQGRLGATTKGLRG